MRNRFLLILIALFTIVFSVNAQVGSDMIVSARVDSNTIHLTWVPVNDTVWAASRSDSYTVIRKDSTGRSELLASGLQPKPQSWFEANRELDGGFVYAIGQILYDQDSPEVNPGIVMMHRHNQYHYLMPEVIRDPFIANALGQGYMDSTAFPGQTYTYEVYFQDSLLQRHGGEVTVDVDGGYGNYNMDTLRQMKFEPPNGISLLDMRLDGVELNQLQVISKAYGDSIVLRWAPNNPTYWNETLREPYAVFRVEQRTGEDSTFSEYVFQDSIAFWGIEEFTPEMIAQDSQILVAAQSLYGKKKSTTEDGIIIQHSEYVMRYGMAMLIADRSALAATALGLRWVDRDVKPGEEYHYVILTRAAANIMENGFIDVVNVIDTSYRVNDFSAEPGDRKITLKWSRLNDQRFTGYLIGRSDDGGNRFKTLTDAPLLIIKSRDSEDGDDYEFLDSIPENYFPYVYRIRGIDAFGDTSVATITEAHGIDLTPPEAPLVYYAETDIDGKILLKWEINDKDEDLDKFHVLLGGSIDGDYTPIAIDLPKATRSYELEELPNTNRSYYFMVVAQDTAGNQGTTLPIYVHLVDSIPPTPPGGLQGLADTTGVVTITWDHNEEQDLIGYRVYMANNPNHEFSQVTRDATPFNIWKDSITLAALDKKVFYKVIAEDRSHNYSDFSEILVLDRPDILPPAAPAMLPTSSDEKGIQLFWRTSPSNDVVAYIIYRRNVSMEDTIRHRIVRIQDRNAAEWRDTSAIPETIYEYTIQAQDQSALLSEFSFPVKGRRRFDLSSLNIDHLEAEFREEYGAVYLRWVFDPSKLATDDSGDPFFYIYKKVVNGNWEKIKQLDSSSLTYLDRKYDADKEITYGIKVVTHDGKSGGMTESPIVNLTK